MHPILVTGASGKTGNAVARQLLAAGHAVRTVLHDRDALASTDAASAPEDPLLASAIPEHAAMIEAGAA